MHFLVSVLVFRCTRVFSGVYSWPRGQCVLRAFELCERFTFSADVRRR